MTFKITFSDQHFQVIAPDGSFEPAVTYMAVSQVEFEGVIYIAYLEGDEPELEALIQHPTDVIMKTVEIRVYSCADWPVLAPMETEIEEVEFDEDEPETGPIVDVESAPVS